MCCGPFAGNITCVKGTDTIYSGINVITPFQVIGNANMLDSITYYHNLGFTCIVKDLWPITSNITYGDAIKRAEHNGWACVEPEGNSQYPPICN